MKKRSTYFILWMLLISHFGWSTQEQYSERLEGSGITSAVFEVYDDRYFDMLSSPTTWQSQFTNYEVKNFVQLGINPSVIQSSSFSGTLAVTIDYQVWNSTTNSFDWGTPLSRTLALSYDASTGTTLIDDLSTVAFQGAHRIKVTVGSITGLSVSNLFLESRIEVERYYAFNASAVTGLGYSIQGTNNDYVEFSWDFKKGAEFYDLEWVHVNDYTIDTNVYLPDTVLLYNYYLNSTRVSISENFYRIPKVFDHGYLIFRVRAVGRQGSDFEYKKYGAWSAGESGTISSHPSGQTYQITTQYDWNMNWSHQVAYSEGGKRMEALSFSDGLGRGRQSVAHNTQTRQAVVSNVYYDELGRAVISDLPTPIDGEQLRHYPDFNRADIAGKPSFQHAYFDQAGDSCLAPMATAFSDTLGTGKYYSSNNADKDGENAYIPDGGGYPYTRITYKNDFSGRVDRVSGAGDTLKMGSGRETQHFYPSSNQYELNELFGSEVGEASHYTKMVTVDPNGQIYVKYSDMAGRVVASYMAGPSPENLDSLVNNVGDSVKIDLIVGGQLPDIGTSTPSTTFSHTEFISEDDETYTFNYSFTPEEYTSACLSGSICFDCVYDFSISVKDGCGVVYWDSTAQINGAVFDASCSSTAQQSYQQALVLPRGEYIINKKLSVNQQAIDAYWCFYIDNDTCTTTLSEFFNDLYENEPFISCVPDSVLQLSDSTGGCDVSRYLMLLDLSPGGQYAEYADSSGIYTSDDPTSIFEDGDLWETVDYFDEYGDTIWVVNAAGDTVTPNQLSSNEFVSLFDDSWAPSMLPLHPEYCYLEFCENNAPSHAYNQAMLSTCCFDSACANGYFHPLGDGPSPDFYGFSLCDSSNIDPFFSDGGWAYETLIKDTMINFLTIQSSTYNMWQAAVISASCPEVATSGAADTCLAAWNDAPSSCLKDLVWTRFREYYLASKMTYYTLAQQEYADSLGCSNACIGNDTTGCEDYRGKVSRFGNIETMFGMDVYAIPDSLSPMANNLAAASCIDLCEGYVDDWLMELSGCDFSALDSTQMADMRSDMIDLCAWGCDLNHLFGATTTAGGPADTTASGHATIDDILNDYLGANYEDSLCSELLISFPGPYVDSSNVFSDVMQPLDTCACDLFYQAQWDLTNDTTLNFTCVEDVLAFNTGVMMGDINYLMCDCERGLLGQSWSPGHIWTPSGQVSMDTYGHGYQVPASLTCSERDCVIDCDTISAAMTLLETRFDVADLLAMQNGDVILTNYLNNSYTYHLTPAEYLDFLYGCTATSADPYCKTSDEALELLDVLKLLTYRGQFTNTVASIVDLNAENIVYEHSEMIDLFEDHDYWSAQSDSTLTIYLDSGGCSISFTAWGDFDFSSIVNFTYIAPTTFNCPDTLNSNFEIGVEYIDCGELVPGILTGTSDCFEINDCVCGDTGQVLCDEFPELQEEPCYEPELSEMYINAMNSWDAAILDAYNTFAQSYNDTCSLAFNTEALSYSGKIRTYQYTLFYYDQAGNLVKTVAPQGKDESFSATQAAINSARASVTSSSSYSAAVLPAHDYITAYQYNSYNQLVLTKNPDQNGNTQFWYDRYGRITASQNPVQAAAGLYSYTFYDALGRPEQVGQVDPASSISEATLKADDLGASFQSWVNAGTRSEITVTVYDEPLNTAIEAKFKNGQQENLRLRVASVLYFEEFPGVPQWKQYFQTAIHYSYDQHGNVKECLQDVPMLEPVDLDVISTQYEFELISGNVKKVIYQEDKLDYMSHAYTYDKLNRLKEVFTARDTIHSTREAHYRYYDYGPLARTEIGKDKVQGLDYAYTINGWLKAMNASTLNKFRDMGKDGNNGSSAPYYTTNTESHKYTAKDVLGYTIGYFSGDYTAIGTSAMEASYAGFAFGNGSSDLYNGNIRHLVTAIEGMDILGTAYRYDQLQRLTQMTAYYNTNAANTWSGMSATTDYFNAYSYDQNGNILTLQRNATATLGLYMDDFTYNYVGLDGNPNASSTSRSNRLNYVSDSGVNDGVADDITNTQTTNNYLYDAIGQLLSDVDEGIDTMYWRYGDKKLRKIIRNDQNSAQLEFYYNPLGQRIIKLEKPRSSGVVLDTAEWVYTYYTYDANGQVMAIYDATMDSDSALANIEEFNIYGSSRIGQIQSGERIYTNGPESNTAPNVWQNILGERSYELTNHLGNVLAVVNDRKLWNATDTLYEAVLLMSSDYYPFGMIMPGRNSNGTESSYRYAYNGMEADAAVKGERNSYTTEFRQYDPRLGRWLSLDPMMTMFPWMSPYVAFNNNPIFYVDPYGLKSEVVIGVDVNSKSGNDDTKKPKRFGAFKRFFNYITGNQYLNDANKYIVENNIEESQIHKSKEGIEIDESHYSREIKKNDKGEYDLEFVYNEKITKFKKNRQIKVIVLLDSEGGSGFGHMALLIGNNHDGWQYFSKGGRDDNAESGSSENNELSGGPSTYQSEPYENFKSFLNDDDMDRYDRFLGLKLGFYDTGNAIIEKMTDEIISDYHAANANCGQAVVEALKESLGSLDYGITKNDNAGSIRVKTTIPDKLFEAIEKTYKKRIYYRHKRK